MYAYVPIFNAARYIILYDIYEFYAKSKTVHTFVFKNLHGPCTILYGYR